jgi:hypothetical protein
VDFFPLRFVCPTRLTVVGVSKSTIAKDANRKSSSADSLFAQITDFHVCHKTIITRQGEITSQGFRHPAIIMRPFMKIHVHSFRVRDAVFPFFSGADPACLFLPSRRRVGKRDKPAIQVSVGDASDATEPRQSSIALKRVLRIQWAFAKAFIVPAKQIYRICL